METNICQNEKNIPSRNFVSSLTNEGNTTNTSIENITKDIKSESLNKISKDTTKTKICKICNIEKNINEFKYRKDQQRHRTECKKCELIRHKKWRDRNKDKIKIYHKNDWNKYRTNRIQSCKNYNSKNKEKMILYRKKYRLTNKKHSREMEKLRLSTNIDAKLSYILRQRFNKALKHNYKAGSAVKDLGCSIDDFKKYLEKKFTIGMTWENYGKHGWHIDHIKPLSLFDLTDRTQLLEACHYTNLQPLWWYDNLSKGSKIL